ncbi:MAG: methyltransferase [Pseudomonadota bacterium]
MPATLRDTQRAQTTRSDPSWSERFFQWRNGLIASPSFQDWAARTPIVRRFARRDGEALYDLVAGFVYSQTLASCVEVGLFHALKDGPRSVQDLSANCDLSHAAMGQLCQAASAIDLLTPVGDGYRLGRLGAAVLGVPGLEDMIRHHAVFYRDLRDPVALLRGQTDPELSRFWAYVLGTDRETVSPQVATEYSALMASSQVLVAEETLRAFDFSKVQIVMDVGGGTGAFLTALGQAHARPDLWLYDLPSVVESAPARFAQSGLAGRAKAIGGSFRDEPLPQGVDLITLVRVCYDHNDDTVLALLRSVHAALPPYGRLVISEPMSGGDRPSRAGDAYFSFYTRAMTTGRPRSFDAFADLLGEAGFTQPVPHKTGRPFITSVLAAQKL